MKERIELLEASFEAACAEFSETGSYQGFWDILSNFSNFRVGQAYQREQIRLERLVTLYRALIGEGIEELTDDEVIELFGTGKTAEQIQSELEGLGINTTREDAICQVLGICE